MAQAGPDDTLHPMCSIVEDGKPLCYLLDGLLRDGNWGLGP